MPLRGIVKNKVASSAETRHIAKMTSVRVWVDWCFRDRTTGRIVIVQLPNVALAVWLVAMTLRLLLESAPTTEELRWVAAGALVVWGLEELLRGVNPWRRAIGGAAATYQIAVIVWRRS